MGCNSSNIIPLKASNQQSLKPPSSEIMKSNQMFNYPLKGQWQPDCKEYVDQQIKQFNENPDFVISEETVGMIREFAVSYFQGMDAPSYMKFIDQVQNTHEKFHGPKYGTDKDEVQVIVQRQKSHKNSSNRPCMIWFHGGGGFMFEAKDLLPITSRVTVECDVTLISVDYRLIPQHRAPKAILDSYAAVKWVIDNADYLKINKQKICIAGESSGGYLSTGVAMKMAELNQAHLIKLMIAIIPQTSDYYIRTPQNMISDFEKNYRPSQLAVYKLSAEDEVAQKKDRWIFPNLMGDEIAKKMPMSFVFTAEFDFFRKGAQELAALLKKNGKLYDICIHPGGHHGFFMRFNFKITDRFFSDLAKAMKMGLQI